MRVRSEFRWASVCAAVLFLASCAAPPGPPATATRSLSSNAAESAAAPQQERPGLGTRWGETRESQAVGVGFRRANPSRPTATAMINYNDAEGIQSMAGGASPRRTRPPLGEAGTLVSVEIRDEAGRVLPGVAAGDRWFVVGEKGRRYSIFVRNRNDFEVEVVLSVDGLDVVDGRAASFRKRGYIVRPYGTLSVDGFRQSTASVAAFRFSSVRDSYANRKHGDTRDVGVIGLAVFHPYGVDPFGMSELEQRLRANPFPGRFATPPEPIPIRPPRHR